MQGGLGDNSDLAFVEGLPVDVWMSTFRYTYSITQGGVVLNGWPDGGPLDAQEEVMLRVLDVVKDETMAVLNEERNKQ